MILKFLKLFIILCLVNSLSNAAEMSSFVFGDDEIKIKLPKNWIKLSDRYAAELNEFPKKLFSDLLVDQEETKKITLIAMNNKEQAECAIRLNIVKPALFIETELRALTKEEFIEISNEEIRSFKDIANEIFKPTGVELLLVRDLETIDINNHKGIVLTYMRTGIRKSIWVVSQYKFSNDKLGYTIELTLSADVKKRDKCEPIFIDILKSLKF